MRFVPAFRLALLLLVAGAAIQWLYALARDRPQDMPWTALDLTAPVGAFTGAKLAALGDDFAQCRVLLGRAGAGYTTLPPRRDAAQCGYDDAVRPAAALGRAALAPAGVGVACPVAAALDVWEREVVQPAALRRFGSRVARIDHFGSYSCRRIYGRDAGNWSEHSRAAAIDVAGFRLADGRRITVARDWRDGEEAAFLHEVRDGACRLFATSLSPDYNAAHRDHLHLDQARRGFGRWSVCR
jgi:hypothetical protein